METRQAKKNKQKADVDLEFEHSQKQIFVTANQQNNFSVGHRDILVNKDAVSVKNEEVVIKHEAEVELQTNQTYNIASSYVKLEDPDQKFVVVTEEYTVSGEDEIHENLGVKNTCGASSQLAIIDDNDSNDVLHHNASFEKVTWDVGSQVKVIEHGHIMEAASTSIRQRYKCHACKRVFINNRTLKKHRRLHSKKEFYCYVCPEYGKDFGQAFPGQDDFDIHMFSHTSTGLFKCRFCAVYFARESIFKFHVRSHKNKIGHATYLSSLFEKGYRAGRRYRAMKKCNFPTI